MRGRLRFERKDKLVCVPSHKCPLEQGTLASIILGNPQHKSPWHLGPSGDGWLIPFWDCD